MALHAIRSNSLMNKTVNLESMTDEERARYAHEQLHEKHRGHEAMHAWMVVILLITVVISQIILVQWKKHYFSSYQRVSMFAMWIVPFVISLTNRWWRFIIIWIILTIITCIVINRALRKPIAGMTPRLVYKWFYLVYMISYAVGIVGYLIIVMTLIGLNLVFRSPPQPWMDVGLLLLFYGLYYGVLTRDIAEIITDKMAATIGYYTSSGMPVRQLERNVCAVCGNPILVQDNNNAIVEKTYNLTCGHVFHEFCIRGWCIIGKKQICPYCKEKVDLKRMFRNPWEKPHILYGNVLDFIRYLVAWQPVIFTAVQFVNYLLGLE